MNFESRHLLPIVLLAALLAGAVLCDVRSRRIPNPLVLAGIVAGLALQATVTPGAGLFSEPFGALGLLKGAAGMGLGLLLLLPMYGLGAMGAGDVKLMAMIGTFLGPLDTLGAGLSSVLAGGLLSLLVALCTGSLRKVSGNVKVMVLGSVLRGMAGGSARVDSPATVTGQLPYAVAIASGTLCYLLLTRYFGWSLL
ncbi:prepilin peptidase CpaA [Duganella sp. CF458]|uniref:A24 family peptidase n=1 Tax=Duganella sp. CF458 TaxID=1884368 RepID=UPI0008F1C5D7|nr:prepilin peptidase [Duganella sp. CF458]SFF92783.1 prepilin peptidase CpaA [Duganella sp. CF458]